MCNILSLFGVSCIDVFLREPLPQLIYAGGQGYMETVQE